MMQKISDNRAKEMENEINQLFNQLSNKPNIKNIINMSIGKIYF